MKVLVDTNVLLDFLCKRDPFSADAEKVFLLGVKHQIDIYICGLSFVNAIYTARKYGVPTEDCIKSLKGLLTFCSVSDINHDILLSAFNSGWKDTEDAVQFMSGQASSVECVITRDKKGFKESTCPIYSPEEFLHNSSSFLNS